MTSRTCFRRAARSGLLIVVLLQLLGIAATSSGHWHTPRHLDTRSLAVPETDGSGSGAEPHDCAICHTLGSVYISAATAAFRIAAVGDAFATQDSAVISATQHVFVSSRPRAPPRA